MRGAISLSLATPAHHHGARWREQVLPQCSLVSKMAKLPGGVCYWVRIYKYIRALKQSARERDIALQKPVSLLVVIIL
jgi:hypothetical protein